MSDNKEFKATVMPREDTEQKSGPNGLPGIQIPANAHEIKEFQEVNNMSAKELNAQMEAELKKKSESK